MGHPIELLRSSRTGVGTRTRDLIFRATLVRHPLDVVWCECATTGKLSCACQRTTKDETQPTFSPTLLAVLNPVCLLVRPSVSPSSHRYAKTVGLRLISGAGTNLKSVVGTRSAHSARIFFCRAPPLFWLYKYNLSFWRALLWWSARFGQFLVYSVSVPPMTSRL